LLQSGLLSLQRGLEGGTSKLKMPPLKLKVPPLKFAVPTLNGEIGQKRALWGENTSNFVKFGLKSPLAAPFSQSSAIPCAHSGANGRRGGAKREKREVQEGRGGAKGAKWGVKMGNSETEGTKK
jgi:hypothetical protein